MSKFKQNKNVKLAIILLAIAIGMFGFGYALVPLYNVMCQALGINGKTGGATNEAIGAIDKTRKIEIIFLAHAQGKLDWKFYPIQKKIVLHPGENRRIAYFAQNETLQPMTVQAIPSVTPGRAAKYLRKTECFCFTQQTLKGKTGMEMPILFHMDKDLPSDIHEVVLSYTLFDVTNRKKTKAKTQTLRRITSE